MNPSFWAPVPCPVLPNLVCEEGAAWLVFSLCRSFIHWSVHLIPHYPLCSALGLTASIISCPGFTLYPSQQCVKFAKSTDSRTKGDLMLGLHSPAQGSSPLTVSLPSHSLDPRLSHHPPFPSLLAIHQPVGSQAIKEGALVSSKHP